MQPKEFLDTFGPICQRVMAKNGGFASVRLAQIILESSWANATPKDVNTGQESYNLTGVKGLGPAGSVKSMTHEYVNGVRVDEYAMFRAYHSFEEHITLRDDIFLWDNYDGYRNATSPEDAVRGLAHAPKPYATDPRYASKLLDIIHNYDLKRFDVKPAAPGPFTDVPGDCWYAEYVKRWKDSGIMSGFPDGSLRMGEADIRVLIMTERMINRAKEA